MKGTLHIHIVEVSYCPLCGRPFFAKKHLEKIVLEKEKIVYKCKRCKSIFQLWLPNYKEEYEKILKKWKRNN